MVNLLGAIAMEAAYQIMVQRGATWSRRKFFNVGQEIVRKHPEYMLRIDYEHDWLDTFNAESSNK